MGEDNGEWVFVHAATRRNFQLDDGRTETACYDFFKVDVREGKKNTRGRVVKLPSSIWDNKDLRYATVAVGGKQPEVYAVSRSVAQIEGSGGPPSSAVLDGYSSDENNHHYHLPHGVARLNLKNKKMVKWEACPLMNRKPRAPVCACLDGKLYVLDLYNSWFGEVFDDPQTGEWSELTNLPNPDQIPGQYLPGSLVPDESYHRFLLCLINENQPTTCDSVFLYSYYPKEEDGKWEFIGDVAPRFHTLWYLPAVVADAVVDGVIYFQDPEAPLKKCIAAYDASNRRWLKVVGCSTLGAEDAACKYRSMLHLGNGVLCLAGFATSCPERDTTTLRFLKFRTTRSSCGTQIRVSRISFQTILLNCSRVANFRAL